MHNLSRLRCDSPEACLELIHTGNSKRAIRAHALDSHKPLGHTVVCIQFQFHLPGQQPVSSELYYVDLADMMRITESTSSQDQDREALKNVNLSLANLQRVFQQIASNGYPSFRDTKLTWLLKDVLTSGTTIFIAALSPSPVNYEETLSTLNFADRCQASRHR